MAENFQAPQLGPEGTVQCEVTGEWLPADETIEFQGQRVGAQGKQILMERIRSGAGPGGLNKPTVLRRWGCWLLDGILVGVVYAIISVTVGIVWGASVAAGADGEEGDAAMAMLILQGTLTVIFGVLVIGYYTVFHGLKGQTPGKMAGKLKVVRGDGSDIDMRTAFLRAIYYQGPGLLASALGVLAFLLVSDSGLALTINAFSGLGGLYILVDLVFALVDSKQQRALHDRLASTRVIHMEDE